MEELAPEDESPSKKRPPKWLVIVLSALVLVLILGIIFGESPEKSDSNQVAASVSTTAPASFSPSYTVTSVANSGSIVLSGNEGVIKTIRIYGVVAPLESGGCFVGETTAWATGMLLGKVVKLGSDTASGISVTLADGTDYSTLALQSGYAKYATEAASDVLMAAEKIASEGKAGLWGTPCLGTIDAPAPVVKAHEPNEVSTKPQPVQQKTTEPKAVEPKVVEPKPNPVVSYPNCAAAKAAGAAPLHKGEPGYSSKLDRDGDGVACET